ncbi:FHA domain-containing protein [Bradyrhizobium sp. HKCCYLS20291]|uniref:FHA domain-containing protein n=1 Tax=Bradyrhizobium sp. HKCCYLS20291 TaxID=3420766 RepID=UPI003EBFF8CC
MSNTKRERDQTIVTRSSSEATKEVDLDDRQTQVRRGDLLAVFRIVDGPGAGTSHPVYKGDNAIGRGPQNRIALTFGDDGMHREGHAWLHAQPGQFVLEHGGKTNPVYVNDEKLQGRRSIGIGDKVKIGVTMLRLDPA